MHGRKFTIYINRRGPRKSVTVYDGPFYYRFATMTDTSTMRVDNYAAELGRMLGTGNDTVEFRVKT